MSARLANFMKSLPSARYVWERAEAPCVSHQPLSRDLVAPGSATSLSRDRDGGGEVMGHLPCRFRPSNRHGNDAIGRPPPVRIEGQARRPGTHVWWAPSARAFPDASVRATALPAS